MDQERAQGRCSTVASTEAMPSVAVSWPSPRWRSPLLAPPNGLLRKKIIKSSTPPRPRKRRSHLAVSWPRLQQRHPVLSRPAASSTTTFPTVVPARPIWQRLILRRSHAATSTETMISAAVLWPCPQQQPPLSLSPPRLFPQGHPSQPSPRTTVTGQPSSPLCGRGHVHGGDVPRDGSVTLSAAAVPAPPPQPRS